MLQSKYPIYVLSKGRSKACLSATLFLNEGIDFYLVVEAQESEEYSANYPRAKIIILPFAGLGAIPVRNFIWQHSIDAKFKRHWIIDDNINGVYRFYKGKRIKCDTLPAIKVIENYVDRYENIGVAGMNYHMFGIGKLPAININCHVYSFMLIDNSMSIRWRGKWNADTDLCLQVIFGGMVSVLFNMFLCYKMPTMKMKGGNTERYKGNGRLKMAVALQMQWPEIVAVTKKYGRAQHHINWNKLKGRLKKRADIDWSTIPDVDESGIVLVQKQSIKSHNVKEIFKDFTDR